MVMVFDSRSHSRDPSLDIGPQHFEICDMSASMDPEVARRPDVSTNKLREPSKALARVSHEARVDNSMEGMDFSRSVALPFEPAPSRSDSLAPCSVPEKCTVNHVQLGRRCQTRHGRLECKG
jgi:hypothetical protein